jgi:exonuclease VII small subunit
VIQQQQTQLLANIDEITKTNNIAATAYDQAKQSLSNSTAAFDNAKVAYDKAISEGKEAWNLARESILQLGRNLNIMKSRFTTMATNLSTGVTNTAYGISTVTSEISEIQTSLNRKILGVPDYVGAFGNTMDCIRNIGNTFTSLKSTLSKLRDDSNNLKNSLTTISQPAAK